VRWRWGLIVGMQAYTRCVLALEKGDGEEKGCVCAPSYDVNYKCMLSSACSCLNTPNLHAYHGFRDSREI